nr:unnamed protein product [Callosobruchus chinensis]
MFARHMLEHPETAAVSSKIHECIYCTYKTTRKDVFARHMLDHPETEDSYQHSTCVHCNAIFKRKTNLDDHIVRKHPDFIASVSSKIHECTHCSYKSVMKANLDHHMLKHPETADSYKLVSCVHCDATYKTKKNLDDHTIRKHPDSIASITSKVHRCAYCTYKTTVKGHFTEHMLKHSETSADIYILRCTHCDATFKRKTGLDNHVIRKHPHFIASVSSKMHECTHCTYKTTMKSNLAKHLLKHEDSDKPKMCSHCNATFKRKINLDEHILRKHPYFMTFVSSKIHECIYCMYKSTRNDNFVRHMLRHAEAADNYKLKTCIHCNTTFERKKHLDEHTVCEHPDFIASVSSKIHQCTRCTFKTVMKANLARHMLKHPDSSNLSRCIYCNATYKSKRNMDNHIIRKHPDSIASVSSKIHECKYCMYKTTVKAQFSEHMTKHPNSIASVSSKIHECTYCAYQTVIKPHFARHMLKHPETADSYKLSRCIHCNAIYKRKMSLDDHILRRHPEHIASVSNKIHECTHCAFKTVMKAQLAHHMLKHPETADGYKFSTCVHCNATFKGKQALDDHTLRKHPDTVGSISTKIYECTHCPYKTSMKMNLDDHIVRKHPHLIASVSSKIRECTQCTYKTTVKEELDEHTIKKHPDAIASVSSKIYECPHCTYKTIIKRSFAGHMLEHPETDICSACIHCNAIFKQKSSLDDHIICKHPDFIASVSSKIHECTHCPYKTVVKSNLVHHNMLKHPETVDSNKFILCVHCNTAYSNKKNLDEHIIRIHPDCIASISSKVHQCGYCSFKTTVKGNFTSHMLNHSETADSFKLNRTCTDCNTTFKSKTYLDEHIIRKHPDFMASVSSKIHECSHCTYQSTIKRKLAIHLLKHG